MKIACLFLLSVLLSACGQTGPLYMPGKATGVHKKDQFILGNSQKPNTTSPGVADTADNSTAPDEDSAPLGGQDTAPPGTVE